MEDTKMQGNPKRLERTQIMTPKEAAKYLGFHLVTIYRLLKKEMVPAVKIGGQWRFKKDVLDAWLLGRMNHGKAA
jgi:excisionase family DNA binding protein